MCRSFYEVQIIAPPSAWQQLAKMGEGIKLTLGMTRKSLMADGKNHRQVPRAERGRAFRMPSADPERPRRRFQLRSGGRASLQDYGRPTHTGRHSAGKTAHGALHLFRDWPTL